MSDPGELPPGLYERLITDGMASDLAQLGERALASPLVDVDSPIRLADHLRRIAERVLAGQGYAGNSHAQAELVNRLIGFLRDQQAAAGESVTEPPRLLEAV